MRVFRAVIYSLIGVSIVIPVTVAIVVLTGGESEYEQCLEQETALTFSECEGK